MQEETVVVIRTGIPGPILGTLSEVEPLDLKGLGCGANSPRQAALQDADSCDC